MPFDVRMRLRCASGKEKTARPSGMLFLARRRFWVFLSVAGDKGVQLRLCRLQRRRIPYRAQLFPNALSRVPVGRVVHSVLGQVKLAALPRSRSQHCTSRGLQASVIIRHDEPWSRTCRGLASFREMRANVLPPRTISQRAREHVCAHRPLCLCRKHSHVAYNARHSGPFRNVHQCKRCVHPMVSAFDLI